MILQGLAIGTLWLDSLASWSSILSAALAILVIAVGFIVSRTIFQTYSFLRQRLKYIYPAVREAGISRSRRSFALSCYSMLNRRAHTGKSYVRDELDWLSSLAGTEVTEEGISESYSVPIPFTFAIPDSQYSAALVRLENAYRAYASSVRRKWLLRSTAGPLVTEEYQCSMATASLIYQWSSFEPMPPEATEGRLRGMKIELRNENDPSNVRLIAWPPAGTIRTTPGFPSLGVSYYPYRVVMSGGPAETRDVENLTLRAVPALPGLGHSNALSFDDVLPRWHGRGYRIEMDRTTGRQKLHLCVSETSFFAYRATQDLSAPPFQNDTAPCSRLLSTLLLAMDQNDVAVLTCRADYVSNAGEYVSTVSGNCELAQREGLRADVDQFGLPDFLGAITREAKEELGLDITGNAYQLSTLGVIQYSGKSELETRALVATARLPVPASDFRGNKLEADPVEGAREMGEEFMAIDLRAVTESRSQGKNFVDWIRTSDELAPQAVGALLLFLSARLENAEVLADRMKADRRKSYRMAWDSTDLARWLQFPLPGKAVRPGKYVSYHPLWR